MSPDSDPHRLPSLQAADAMQLLMYNMVFTEKHEVTNVRWNISHNHNMHVDNT